jgi:hypothetical protein
VIDACAVVVVEVVRVPSVCGHNKGCVEGIYVPHHTRSKIHEYLIYLIHFELGYTHRVWMGVLVFSLEDDLFMFNLFLPDYFNLRGHPRSCRKRFVSYDSSEDLHLLCSEAKELNHALLPL